MGQGQDVGDLQRRFILLTWRPPHGDLFCQNCYRCRIAPVALHAADVLYDGRCSRPDRVGRDQRRKAVRDDNQGPAMRNAQIGVDDSLAVGVERARSLVENRIRGSVISARAIASR